MAKQALIHIGVHKTGTTSIQHWLSQNAQHVKDETGWEYPAEFQVDGAHHVIPWSVRDSFSQNPVSRDHRIDLNQIRSTLVTKDKVIISSEPLCVAGDSDVEKISELFAGFETTVVIYVRRQDKLIQAEYTQRVKQEVFPLGDSFDAFAMTWEKSVPALDFFRLAERWRRHFNRIVIIDFDAAIRSGLTRSLLSIIGHADVAQQIDMHSNASPSYHYIAALRELNMLEKLHPGLRHKLEKHVRQLKYPDGKFSFFDAGQAARFLVQFEASNKALAESAHYPEFSGFQDNAAFVHSHNFVETRTARYTEWFTKLLTRLEKQ